MNRKQTILAVDDEPRNLKILRLSLKDEWGLKTAASGEEALEILKTDAPDVILLDIMMPGLDGYEICRRIRQTPKLEFTKVILVSGKALLEERLKGYEVGADDYMTKPFIPDELLAKVKVFMRLNLVEQQLKDLTLSLDEKVRVRTQQLADAEAKLVNSAKMSVLGEMAGGIAHEINTPLGVIMLVIGQVQDLLLEQPINVDVLLKLTARIEKTTRKIGEIVQGLRTFSRDSGRDNFETKSLKEIIDSTLNLCAEKFKYSDVALTIESIPENLMIECRASQLSQVFLNLLNNACDAVEKRNEKWIKVSVQQNEKFVKIRVMDSGPGIPIEVRDKLFQPFFTTKDIGKGTGLGLSISKGLIEAHHGSLLIDSNSVNTCFEIEVPKKQFIDGAV